MQPGEAVYLKMNSKAPGLAMRTVPTEMDLTYKRRFSDMKIPEAYEALILDAFKGDHSNFVRDDELDSEFFEGCPETAEPQKRARFRRLARAQLRGSC